MIPEGWTDDMNVPLPAGKTTEEVIERGLGLFAGLLKKGMASGELRTLEMKDSKPCP